MSFCSIEHFSFPEILGTQLQTININSLEGYDGYSGFKPEIALMNPGGVHACNVTVSYTHPGHNDSVSVEIWLPTTKYNSRFVGVGGGGWVAREIGNGLMSVLASQGYAVATTNAGYEHDFFGTADSWLMKSPGDLDYPLVVNFAHRSLHEMSVIAKHIIKEAYDSVPEFSYWHGCSTGGRQGLTIAQDYPDDYDGILTSCTAVNFPGLLMAMYWPQFVMNQNAVYPPACEFDAIVSSVVDLCDEADGVKDGIVARPDLCNIDPASLTGRRFDCETQPSVISADAVDIYKAMLKGPLDPEGNQLFSGTVFGTAVVGYLATANTVCDDRRCFRGKPFQLADDWIRLMVKKDSSFDATKMSHSEYAQLFRKSVQEWGGLFNSDNPDLRRFRLLGKKMISWHSINDEAVPVAAMRQYYEQVLTMDQKFNITTYDYYRYFEAAGATHCSAPPGVPYPLDALEALKTWVEEGIPPERLPAVPLGDVSGEGQIRPICVYPKTAILTGSGFVCAHPLEAAHDGGGHDRDEL